jgi:hypothetical protein
MGSQLQPKRLIRNNIMGMVYQNPFWVCAWNIPLPQTSLKK